MTDFFPDWLTSKAFLTSLGFVIAGLVGWAYAPDARLALPLIFFYGTLAVNTYFSMNFFKTPNTPLSHAIDVLLAVLYLLLAATFADPLVFMFVALCLFILATIKYRYFMRSFEYKNALARKIKIDFLGVLFCAAILFVIALGYVALGEWVFALVFLLANIYLLILHPMYQP